MKITGKIFIFLIVVFTSCGVRRPYYSQQGQGRISTQIFYDQLSPYGNWVHNREYGYVWIPDVGRNFYPYATNGRWIMTDYGWTWVSGYEWGWAPFHYGRWDYDPNYGWFWFPGDEWGPAWVTWRSGNGFYGWAPLRPGMNPDMGLRGNYLEPYRFVFVREHDFGKPNIQRYYVNQRRNDDILNRTNVIDNYYTDDRRRVRYVAGPEPSEIERTTGRRVNRIAVKDNDRPGNRLSNNQLQIYRPVVVNDNDRRPAPSRISDIKDIRPMRERNRNYQPPERGVPRTDTEIGQGNRSDEPESGQIEERRRRDVDREYRQKQLDRQRKQQEIEIEQQSRQTDNDQPDKTRKEQVQRKTIRKQNTDQQKKQMERERKIRETEVTDSTRTKKTERVQVRSTRRR